MAQSGEPQHLWGTQDEANWFSFEDLRDLRGEPGTPEVYSTSPAIRLPALPLFKRIDGCCARLKHARSPVWAASARDGAPRPPRRARGRRRGGAPLAQRNSKYCSARLPRRCWLASSRPGPAARRSPRRTVAFLPSVAHDGGGCVVPGVGQPLTRDARVIDAWTNRRGKPWRLGISADAVRTSPATMAPRSLPLVARWVAPPNTHTQ